MDSIPSVNLPAIPVAFVPTAKSFATVAKSTSIVPWPSGVLELTTLGDLVVLTYVRRPPSAVDVSYPPEFTLRLLCADLSGEFLLTE